MNADNANAVLPSTRPPLVVAEGAQDVATATFGREGELLLANHAWQVMMQRSGVGPASMSNLLSPHLARGWAGEEVNTRLQLTDRQGVGCDYQIAIEGLQDREGRVIALLLNCRVVRDMPRPDSREQLLQARLETVTRELDDLCYSISHDLRAPLRAIDGFSGMLERRAAERLDGEDKRLLGVVRDSGRTVCRLIDKLLLLSRITNQPMAPATTDMTSLVRDAWLDVGGEFGGEFEVDALPSVWCDRPLLKQLWLQLLTNAIKYQQPGSNAHITIRGRREAGECLYEVYDNGVGFDPRYAAKLFKVFQRLHGPDEFPGDGIGLAIVARIVSRHGGRVWAQGERGQGATFGFALPQEALFPAPGEVYPPARSGH